MSAAANAGSTVVRRATADHAALLADLGARTFQDTFGAQNTEADMSAYLAASFDIDVQVRELADPGSTFLVAEIGGQAVGYTRLRIGDAPACIPGARPIEIVRFYVVAPRIGTGVGTALMTASLAEVATRECDAIWLDVWELNLRAIAFYSRWGLSIVGEQEFVLGSDVQHDLLMARAASQR